MQVVDAALEQRQTLPNQVHHFYNKVFARRFDFTKQRDKLRSDKQVFSKQLQAHDSKLKLLQNVKQQILEVSDSQTDLQLSNPVERLKKDLRDAQETIEKQQMKLELLELESENMEQQL